MKRISVFLASILCLSISSVVFAFDSGSTGADGAFSPTTNTLLDMTAKPDGVFNFTTVNIPSGVTVTFKKNANNTPVTILATGDVTISGTISVAGGAANTNVSVGASGPGGYDGGKGGPGWGWNGYKGNGPGGGGGGNNGQQNGTGAGGGFGWAGANSANGSSGGSAYGNAYLVPLMGGSGGGGAGSYNGYVGAHGGGGGGAILISSSGTITVNGAIWANGGTGGSNAPANFYSSGSCYNVPTGGGGSGGAIRLVADTIKGEGTINADGGPGGTNVSNTGNCPSSGSYTGGTGAGGRIRIEANHYLRTSATSPVHSFAVPSYTTYPAELPSLAIASISGVAVPADTKGDFIYPDLILPYGTANPVPVVISAKNIPAGTPVSIKVTPQSGTGSTVTATLAADPEDSTKLAATANVNLVSATPNVITLSATYTVASLFGSGELYAQGEKVKGVRVESVIGENGSKVFYITESGKEMLASL